MSNLMNRFSFNPANLDIPRSVFDRSCSNVFTADSGFLIPFYVDEVLPGDTASIHENVFIRMSTPILPTADSLYCDCFFFFVPMRLIYNSYKQFFGENDSTAWTRSTSLELPHLDNTSIGAMITAGKYKAGSLLDYMGVHLGCDDEDSVTADLFGKYPISAFDGLNTLPIRAYYCVANEWFVDQNYQAPIAFSKGNSGTNDHKIYHNEEIHQAGLVWANAFHDYFTSALPAPQKSASVIPVGSYTNPFVRNDWYVPVEPVASGHMETGQAVDYLKWREVSLGVVTGTAVADSKLGISGTGNTMVWGTGESSVGNVVPSNLYAKIPANIFANVNQIRYAFALQRFFEKDARGGTRYREKVKAHFGVTGSDSSMMVPEYLGGERFMLNMDTIVTTANTSDGTTGEYAGYSKTFKSVQGFSKSFSEHGYLLGLVTIRNKRSYFQGFERMWSRKDQLDFYWPSFANLGEQPILQKEIYADATLGSSQAPDAVFGYQEAFAEYRFKPNGVAGLLRPTAKDYIAGYTYARKLASNAAKPADIIAPHLADVAQTLAVPTGPQFLVSTFTKGTWRRPMPVYSIPGLVDHH